MVRNLSFKADDDFDVKLYSASKRKGMGKSEFIRNSLEKAIENEIPGAFNSNLKEHAPNHLDENQPNILDELVNKETNINVNLVNEKEKKSLPNFLTGSMSDSRTDEPKKFQTENISSAEAVNKNQENITQNTQEKKEQQKNEAKELKELKELKSETNPQDNQNKQTNNVNQSSNLISNKINNNQGRIKPKFTIRKKVNRVNDEESQPQGVSNREIEHRVNKILEEKKFNESFGQMHKKIDAFCEDGKCLRTDVDSLKTKLGKIDEICEDGKCLKTEVGSIKKDLAEMKEFKKWADDIKLGLTDLKGNITNIDKKLIKKESCPECNTGIEEDSSYCPNCGLEIKEWLDESGKRKDWKPFKLRNK